MLFVTIAKLHFTRAFDKVGLNSALSQGCICKVFSCTQVDGDNHWFYDTEGRVVIFHGVNSVHKAFPWYADYLYDDARLDDLVDFGLNIMRLGSMWAGLSKFIRTKIYIDSC